MSNSLPRERDQSSWICLSQVAKNSVFQYEKNTAHRDDGVACQQRIMTGGDLSYEGALEPLQE